MKLLLILCLCGFLGVVSQVNTAGPVDAGQYLSDQQAALGRTYSTGLNRKPCLNILRGVGVGGDVFPWAQIFNTAYWIPVVPTECVVCIENKATATITECPGGDGLSIPLPLNLIPQIIIRLYGLIVSISIYALALVVAILGIRFLVGGLAKGGTYQDTAKNLRTVSSALIISLIGGTIFLQILFTVLGAKESDLTILQACIPTSDKSVFDVGGVTGTDADFCKPKQ